MLKVETAEKNVEMKVAKLDLLEAGTAERKLN